MHAHFDNAIQNLRDASDWNLCRESLSVFSTALTREDVVSIIVKLIRYFLLQYTESVIDDPALNEALSMTVEVKEPSDLSALCQSIRTVLQDKTGSPGINNYRNALKKIGQLATYRVAEEDDTGLFLDIVSALILAIEDYQWGTQYPELWQKSFEHKNRTDFFIRAKYFVTNPGVIELNKALWNLVADAIEKRAK